MNPLRAIIVETPDDSHSQAYNLLAESGYKFDPSETELFEYIKMYVEQHNALPSSKYITYHFKNLGRPDIMAILEDIQQQDSFPYDDFKDFIYRHQELEKDKLFEDLLKSSLAIHKYGEQIGKSYFKGRNDAVNYVYNHIEKFASTISLGDSGSLNIDAPGILSKYEESKENPMANVGILSGIKAIDSSLRGIRRGELFLVLGYTGSGKTTLSMNWGYHAAIHQGKNVVIISLEMPKDAIERTLVTIHSANPIFSATGYKPIPTRGLLDPHEYPLTDEEETFLKEYVIPDLTQNKSYGNIHIEYPGESFTISSLKGKLVTLHKKRPIDLLILDYPGLMDAEKQHIRDDYVSRLNQIMKSLKQVALTFDTVGIPILCPFQANRDGWERAGKNNGVYDLRAISYANEAEKSADAVIANYKNQNDPELLISFLKFRRGPLEDPRKISVLWPSGYMSDLKESEAINPDEVDWDKSFI